MVSTFFKNDSWEVATDADQDFAAQFVSPADNFTNQSIYILKKSFYILFVVFELDFECGVLQFTPDQQLRRIAAARSFGYCCCWSW